MTTREDGRHIVGPGHVCRAPRIVAECWTCDTCGEGGYEDGSGRMQAHRAAGHDVREMREAVCEGGCGHDGMREIKK